MKVLINKINQKIFYKALFIMVIVNVIAVYWIFLLIINTGKPFYNEIIMADFESSVEYIVGDDSTVEHKLDEFNHLYKALFCFGAIYNENGEIILSYIDDKYKKYVDEANYFNILDEYVTIYKYSRYTKVDAKALIEEDGYLKAIHEVNIDGNPEEVSIFIKTKDILDKKYYFVGAKELNDVEEAIGIFTTKFNYIMFVIIGIIIIVTYYTTRYFIKPLTMVENAISELACGNYDCRIKTDRIDEVGRLANGVDVLIDELSQVDKMRQDVFANISHELKTPLVLIRGYSEMLRDLPWENEKIINTNLDLIINESVRMSNMVNEILDYAQFSSGAITLNKKYILISTLIEQEYNIAKATARNYNIDINLHFDIYRATTVNCDYLRLSQVMRNLLNNAINHSYDGTTVLIKVAYENKKDIIVKVINEGEQIPEESRKHLFERYYRVQHQGGRREGTGIGLSIVKSIYEAHNYKYGVEFENACNIFYFIIPRDDVL